MICILVILPETRQWAPGPFCSTTSSVFLWSYELDLLQDGTVAAQGIPAGVWEEEDYPVD